MTLLKVLGALALIAGAFFLVRSPEIMSVSSKTLDPNLAGRWKLVSLTVNGVEFQSDQLKQARMEIKDRSFTLVSPPNGTKRASIASVGNDGPVQGIELVVADGNHAGKTVSGIYQTDKEALKICLSDVRSESVPGEFESPEGSYFSLMQFRKAE